MTKKAKRYFNTSDPNLPDEHYTLQREALVKQGIQLVNNNRYFTIWAPRQTGKSTYFLLLARQLKARGFKVTHVNLENYTDVPVETFFDYLTRKIGEDWGIQLKCTNFGEFQNNIAKIKEGKHILIIDEIEGLNPQYFGSFLHSIRNLYHSRDEHCLKSVILVGVSNIVGLVQDNASPFNIADNLDVPYFTMDETFQLFHMHEEETGQVFHDKVKRKIAEITACQPGLVNGFAFQLVKRHPGKGVIDYEDYLIVEDWYLTEAIDKNISNIINKAKQHREFVERMLFTTDKEKFKINDERMKFLHSHGLIRKDSGGYVEFWVPLYQKAVYDAFYPYSNGERKTQMQEVSLRLSNADIEAGRLDFDKILEGYRAYVKKRGFSHFRQKDENGKWTQVKEAALVYSFESYIEALLQIMDGKSYLEPHAGSGRSDMIINIRGKETVIEFKVYRDRTQFEKGKKQVAYYARSLSIDNCVYLVFVPSVFKKLELKDEVLEIEGVTVRSYVIWYDETKDF